LLSTLGALYLCGSKVIKFDVMDVKPRLPYHLAFQIHVDFLKYTIKRIFIDEGVATCVMSLTCWKYISSPTLSQSPTMLTAFDDGRSFPPRIIPPSFSVQLGGKTVEVDIEVVGVPLDYKLLLRHSWTYAMIVVVSSIFYTLFFPHEGKIVTIDQLSFAHSSPNASIGPLIPVISNYQPTTEDIGVKLYSSLMGTFDFMAPIHHIYAMFSMSSSSMRYVFFHTLYFKYPWTFPTPTMSFEVQSHIGMAMPLSVAAIGYQVVLDSTADPDHVSSQEGEEDHVLKPVWATSSSFSHDFLNDTLPSNEFILEAMNGPDKPWDDMDHRSYFLQDIFRIEQDDFRSTLSEMVSLTMVPLDTHGIYVEGNMASISPIVAIDICRILGNIENVYIGADCFPKEIHIYIDLFKEFCDVLAWSYEEMSRIDPRIVEHEIKIYSDDKHVRQ
jgi:hypothetical protein